MIFHLDKYKVLAEKYDMSVSEIQKICDSQFEFTTFIMSSANDEQVRLQGLGLFHVPSTKLKYSIKYKDESRRREKFTRKLPRRGKASEDSISE